MKLFLNGKMFASFDTMTVTGEDGEELYYLKHDKTSAERMATLSAADGTKIADIRQRGTSFAVLMDGEQVALVERKSTIKPGYTVTGPDWDVSGSLFSTKYEVTKDGMTIAELKVAMLKSEIEVADDTDLALKVAVAMAIRFALYCGEVVGSMMFTAVGPH